MAREGESDISNLVDRLAASSVEHDRIQHLSSTHLPNRDVVLWVLEQLHGVLFPGFFGARDLTEENLREHMHGLLEEVRGDLESQIAGALRYHDETPARARDITGAFLDRLPEIRRLLSLDVQAAYDGDPAARHTDEAVLCYPGVRAVTVHRIAHELLKFEVPLIPRIMQEWAHAETGIDIHPGATIGESFFIDHGTGVVIGETTVIGRGCKVYQGVTLGAKSFPKDERGRLKRGVKRHPTLEDDVTVYA
ncbi:MAG: hypothetical protein P8I74_05900, partial [Phycisphaerales bacterium]|nr:hypothetical protein [Phycisphaerales bacterium]